MENSQKNNINNIIKPFLELNLFFLVITIIFFGLLALTSASIEFSAKKFEGASFYLLFRQLAYLVFSIIYHLSEAIRIMEILLILFIN